MMIQASALSTLFPADGLRFRSLVSFSATEYARRQMMALNAQLNGDEPDSNEEVEDIPAVLSPAPRNTPRQSAKQYDYFTFGDPHIDILNTFREMQDEHGIVLDLLYGAPAWTILLRHLRQRSGSAVPTQSSDPETLLDGREIMYVHSGGCEGINTQLLRYRYKNLVDMDEIQLPGRSTR